MGYSACGEVFAHALPMIMASLSAAYCCLWFIHTMYSPISASYPGLVGREKSRWGYSIEYVICFLLMQGARVEAGEAEGNKAVQR